MHRLVESVAGVQHQVVGSEAGGGAGAFGDGLQAFRDYPSVEAAQIGEIGPAGAGGMHGDHPSIAETRETFDRFQEGFVQVVGELEERRLTNYLKLIREEEHNSASLSEKRAKDKALGKFYKKTLGEATKLKGR